MNRAAIAVIITLVLAAVTFMAGPKLWPPIMDPQPTSGQLPFFIFLAVIESLVFGFGIALIYIASPYLKKVPQEKKTRTWLAFVSLIWLLVSWWPHGNLHMHVGLDFSGLLKIDYGFHLTIMIASLFLTYYFVTGLKEKQKL